MKKILHRLMLVMVGLTSPMAASAAQAIARDTPIEISSDKLDVFQNEHKAIFTGNVIAVQGTTNMRSTEMVVFYRDSGNKTAPEKPETTPAANETPATPQGIYRIEAKGSVVFTTPTETALGDTAIYNVDDDTIDLLGSNVTLTRGQNILKGTKLNYNMATGRSVLTGGATTNATTGKPSRVHGLFVPKSDKPAAGK